MKNFLDDLIIELDKGIKSSLSNRQEYERAYPAESIHEAELNEFEKNNKIRFFPEKNYAIVNNEKRWETQSKSILDEDNINNQYKKTW